MQNVKDHEQIFFLNLKADRKTVDISKVNVKSHSADDGVSSK